MKYICLITLMGWGLTTVTTQIFIFDANQAEKGGMCSDPKNFKKKIPCKITFPVPYSDDGTLPIKEVYYENGIDYPGNDLENIGGTDLDNCFRRCYNNPRCVAVVSNTSYNGKVSNSPQIPGTGVECWLKSALGGRTTSNSRITWKVK